MSGPVFVALVNPKSGGNAGAQLVARFKEILDEERVHNLTDQMPMDALKKYTQIDNLRIIACGGDGTVGWILSTLDALEPIASWRSPPAIGIVPLGTGNDLSRSLNWGGRFRDKPVRKVLIDIAKADVIDLDRWALTVSIKESSNNDVLRHNGGTELSSELPMGVMNNYFSVGVDAHIALQFHIARNRNPGQFTSRTRNLIFYGLEGGKDLFRPQYRRLMDHVSIECDGVDYTHKLRAYGTHSVLFLNIRTYAGGTKPWNRKNGSQEINDGLMEVVALDNLDLAILHAGGTGASVCQCRTATISTSEAVPMQIDGEPVMMRPCSIVITHRNRGKMLVRNKTATYAVRDEEIENWAAKKIQSSFKQYKYQKNLTHDQQNNNNLATLTASG